MAFDSAEIDDPTNPRFLASSTGIWENTDRLIKHIVSSSPLEMPTTKLRKIAIVGSASSTSDKAPYDDPDWEVWILAWRVRDHKRFDRVFEIHRRDTWRSCQGGTEAVLKAYTEMLQKCEKPVYTLEIEPDIPQSRKFPMAECTVAIGADYYASSIGYMLAEAIRQHKTGELIGEIGVWGVDLLCDDEWSYQRPNAEYLLGICFGLGMKVTIPKESAILKMNHTYGMDDTPGRGAITKEWIDRKIADMDQDRQQHLQHYWTCDGAVQFLSLLAGDVKEAENVAWLEKIALTDEQKTIIKDRLQLVSERAAKHKEALIFRDGGLEANRYIKIMLEHHARHGVIPG